MTATPASAAAAARRAATPTAFSPVTGPTAILVDLFPAEATLPDDPDSKVYPARVIITADSTTTDPDTVYVFTDSSAGPALLYSAPATGRTGSNREGAATTPEGSLAYTRAGGCGCGSALKSFVPFTHPYSVA